MMLSYSVFMPNSQVPLRLDCWCQWAKIEQTCLGLVNSTYRPLAQYAGIGRSLTSQEIHPLSLLVA